MEVRIRLRKLLQEHRLDRKGVINQIAREAGLHRHVVAKLYHDKSPSPSLSSLTKVSNWLRDHGIPAEILPMALLGSRPAKLFEAVARPGTVRIYIGEYQDTQTPEATLLWTNRRDTTVAGMIVQALTAGDNGGSRPWIIFEYVPFRYLGLRAELDEDRFRQDVERSEGVFRRMQSHGGLSTSVLVGSQRTNYLVERVVADLFGCEPFVPVGRKVKVPFHLVYRGRDRAVPSCFGGLDKPPGCRERKAAGVYYLDKRGRWAVCPFESGRKCAGIILTTYDSAAGGLTLGIMGFSGRGTEALGRKLLLDAAPFWPPYAGKKGREVGVYVCRFEIGPEGKAGVGQAVRVRNFKVVGIDEKVLNGCLT